MEEKQRRKHFDVDYMKTIFHTVEKCYEDGKHYLLFNPEELYKAVALDIYMDPELRKQDIPFEYLVHAYCIEDDCLVSCNQRLYKFVERALGGTFRDILEWCENGEEEVYDNTFNDPYEYDENGMCYC